MSTCPPPGRTAVRPAWEALPERVRRAVAERLPAPVTAVAGQGGGFTPGVAARLRLADGGAAFVKAIPAAHPLAGVHRHEGRVTARLRPYQRHAATAALSWARHRTTPPPPLA
ncbi:hypothetical protein FAF44_26010 [Nonomuraea sp. MG754425]|uniref:hypothetical protein n=1 Tax=Nonomuraea sp. MG754425 TaxID=2570319 RepID=UPI001F2B5B9B|nr:hypothetical protein [Nonomuraea sp. MG754425]MCF6471821.1 hypothetical protein [Nonomuraea sp. MG754425]